MKLVVGSRGNFNSTKAIIEGTEGRIAEVYLSVENTRFGSGRNFVHEVDIPEIARQVSFAGKYNVKISLAFNTVCFGKKKFCRSFQQDLRHLMRELESIGIDRIIVSDPYIMEIIMDEVPEVKIIVSVFSEVDSINRLEFYNRMGVDRIIIPHELNRNLGRLKEFVEKSLCDLEVILNLGCSHYCARADCHSMFTGHYTDAMRRKVFGDCYNAWCNKFKLDRPRDFLSQDWIRPEDVYRYEEIGIKYFKIAGRATSTTWVIRAANAFLDRKYSGNIFNLISTYYPFIDRMPGKKSPLFIANRQLDKYMDILYSCGHRCDQCERCGEFYDVLIGRR